MKKTSIMVSIAFALVFAAGVAVGTVAQQRQKPPHDFGAFLAEKLNLTSEQQQQMKAIWSNAMTSDKTGRNKYQELRDQRDTAINTLLTASQLTEYQAINDTYREQFNKMRQARRDAIDKAVAETRKLLTPAQLQIYDKLRPDKQDGWRKPSFDHGPDHGPRPHSPKGAPGEPDDMMPHDPPAPNQQSPHDSTSNNSSTSNGEQK